MDDQITSTDDASMTACLGSADAKCVWLHDRDGSNSVDFRDQGVFLGFYPPGGPAPPELGMPARGRFDSNGDGYIDLWDFYGFQQALGSQDPVLLTIFDADTNGTVTLADYATFASSQSSPGAPSWTRPRNTSRFGNPYMWTGQRRDATTGQYHFTFRTFSPRLGRWVQRDPLGYVDGVSLYEYVGSNPIIGIDRLGLQAKWRIRRPGLPTIEITVKAQMNVSKSRLIMAIRALQQLGYTNLPTSIVIDGLPYDGVTGITNTVTLRDAIVGIGNVNTNQSWLSALLSDNSLIDLMATLVHEQAHIDEGRPERILNWRWDGTSAYDAEISFLRGLQQLLHILSWFSVFDASSVQGQRLMDKIQRRLRWAEKFQEKEKAPRMLILPPKIPVIRLRPC